MYWARSKPVRTFDFVVFLCVLLLSETDNFFPFVSFILFLPGRYRSSGHVVADLRYVIETNMLKKARAKLAKESERTKLTELHELFNSFLDHEFAPNLVL